MHIYNQELLMSVWATTGMNLLLNFTFISNFLFLNYLYFYFYLYDGCDDGENSAVEGVRTDLPRLERHVDVDILNQSQTAKVAGLE